MFREGSMLVAAWETLYKGSDVLRESLGDVFDRGSGTSSDETDTPDNVIGFDC